MLKAIVCMLFIFISPYIKVYADSVVDNRVTVEGTISFKNKEETKKEDSKLGDLVSDSFNKLPKTGEANEYYWILGLIIIFSFFSLLYFIKRKRAD